jgi:hypothetical protein
MVHQVAYQLIVTHCKPVPSRGHPPNKWEFSNPRFNDQKRSQKRVIAIDPAAERYGWARALSTALTCQGFHHFDRLFALPMPHDWASVAPPRTAFGPGRPHDFEDKDFP